METIAVFEQIHLTKEQLAESNIMEYIKELNMETSNRYLKYRLKNILQKWRDIVKNDSFKMRKSHRTVSSSVFEAVIMDDDQFFETTSVPELLHRLLKSFDKNYKVIEKKNKSQFYS